MTKVVTLSRSSPITIETDLVWRLIAPTARSVPTTITSTFMRTISVADLRHLLCLGGGRRKNEVESNNDREPDQPHGHLLGGGWLGGSLAEPARNSTSTESPRRSCRHFAVRYRVCVRVIPAAFAASSYFATDSACLPA